MFTSDEPGADFPEMPTTIANGEEPPSAEDQPAESEDRDDLEDGDGEDNDIIDILIADDLI